MHATTYEDLTKQKKIKFYGESGKLDIQYLKEHLLLFLRLHLICKRETLLFI